MTLSSPGGFFCLPVCTATRQVADFYCWWANRGSTAFVDSCVTTKPDAVVAPATEQDKQLEKPSLYQIHLHWLLPKLLWERWGKEPWEYLLQACPNPFKRRKGEEKKKKGRKKISVCKSCLQLQQREADVSKPARAFWSSVSSWKAASAEIMARGGTPFSPLPDLLADKTFVRC